METRLKDVDDREAYRYEVSALQNDSNGERYINVDGERKELKSAAKKMNF